MATLQELLKSTENKRKLFRMVQKETEMVTEHLQVRDMWKDRENYLSNKLKKFVPVK